MRIWPHLIEYFKMNRLSWLVLALFIIFFVLNRFTPLGDFLRKKQLQLSEKNDRKKQVTLLFLICLAGVLLRIGWVDFCRYTPAVQWNPPGKHIRTFTEYDKINVFAIELTKGIWFRDVNGKALVDRPIGYPMFLGIFYKIFGPTAGVAHVVQIVLSVFTAILVYALTAQMFDKAVALLAAFLYAIYPLSIYSTSLTIDEHLFVPLWLFGIYLLFKEIKGKPAPFALLWYGLIFGYATMTRTHTIFMPLVVGLLYFRLRYGWKRIIIAALAVFAIGQLITLPWMIRNYREFGTVIPYTATNHWLYFGNNPMSRVSTERYDQHRNPRKGEPGYSQELNDAMQAGDLKTTQKLASQKMWEWVFQHPLDFAVLGIEKWLHFMGKDKSRGVWVIDLIEESLKESPELKLSAEVKEMAEDLSYGFYNLLLYSLFGWLLVFVRNYRKLNPVQRTSIFVVGWCFFFYLCDHFIIYAERKYRYPLEIFMLMATASFLMFLLRDARWNALRLPIFHPTKKLPSQAL